MAKSATDESVESGNPATPPNSNRTNEKGSCLPVSLRKNVAIVSICALTLVIILLIATIILLLKRNEIPVTLNILPNKDSFPNDEFLEAPENSSFSSNFSLISRMAWLAQPPVQPADPLKTPVPYVIIHHTATENCSSQAECVFRVRFIQTFHQESRNWWDIGFNFLVGGDGRAYEGRGWNSVGAHTYGHNSKSMGIAFIGTFNNLKPPQQQLTACKRLIDKGVELGFIRKDYKLLGARQFHTTTSPGMALYEEIKTWDHWDKNP